MDIAVILTIVIIALIIAAALYIVITGIKRTEKEKYYTAAGNILKEDFLNYSLQNPANTNGVLKNPNARKIMIYLKSVGSKDKKRFVFDPEKKVLIGRDKEKSNIYLNEAFVSVQHCCIFSENMHVFLSDMNSANGTMVSRGLFTKYCISNQNTIELLSGDKVTVGSNKFKITLFYYDMILM